MAVSSGIRVYGLAAGVLAAGLLVALITRDIGPSGFLREHLPARSARGHWRLVLDRPGAGKYESVMFVDSTHGWVVDALGSILHSADGGATWTVQATEKGPLRTIEFIDRQRGFAGTVTGTLYATVDGGRTWNDITATLPRPSSGFCGMSHAGQVIHTVGRYLGGGADYFFSTDAGKTWTAIDLGSIAAGLVDVAFLTGNIGLIGGIGRPVGANRFGGALILRTTDGGRTWQKVYESETERSFAWKIFPVSATVIYASLQSGDSTYRVAKSTDAGVTWRTITVATGVPPTAPLQGIGFIDQRTGWVGGFFRGMYETRDGGNTWRHIPVPTRTVNQYAAAGRTIITAGSSGILGFDTTERQGTGALSIWPPSSAPRAGGLPGSTPMPRRSSSDAPRKQSIIPE